MGNLCIFELRTHAPKDNLIIVIVRQVIKRERDKPIHIVILIEGGGIRRWWQGQTRAKMSLQYPVPPLPHPWPWTIAPDPAPQEDRIQRCHKIFRSWISAEYQPKNITGHFKFRKHIAHNYLYPNGINWDTRVYQCVIVPKVIGCMAPLILTTKDPLSQKNHYTGYLTSNCDFHFVWCGHMVNTTTLGF